jgi:hypothetical protein
MNGFRRNDLIRLASTGWVYSVDQLDSMQLLEDDEEREWVRDLLAARHAGFNLHALQAQADQIINVVGQRAPRLAVWLRANRSPVEVVAFVQPGDNDTTIVEKFVEAGAGKSTGRKKYALPPGHWRPIGSGRTLEKDGFTPLRRQKLAAAEKALADADGDVRRAALALGVQAGTLRRNLSYRHLDKRMPEQRERDEKRDPEQKATPTEGSRKPEVSPLAGVDPALITQALAALKKFKQK